MINDFPSIPVQSGTPYFMGKNALVKFSGGEAAMGPETFWLVDKDNKTLRPFESQAALENAFGEGLEQAMQNVVTMTSPTVDDSGSITEGVFREYNILDPDYSIKEDGSTKKLHFSSSQLKKRYGKPIDMNAEGLASEAVDGFLSLLSQKEVETGITAHFVNQLKQDNSLMAFYISAMAYGEYTLNDVFTDISRRFKRENKKTPEEMA